MRKYDGMFESLSVDMLSGEETRLLAEHLAECPSCREGCAMLFSVGAYDDAPMRDRMNAYEENGAAEEDENWLKIAFMVNPKLKKAKANDETLVKDAILTSTSSVDYKIEKERDNEPTLAPIAKSERRTERKREKNAILSWRD
ncbi:MAG: zf-HC2 domain-containing protein, partial [Thermoguttaceae bacterium]|nr:zf-HC2 domain-containing protein [Thermoguttaceae bacterium]